MALSPVDYLAIGHVTYDLLPDGSRAVGGTAAYAGLTARALGRRVGLLTSMGPDFDSGALGEGIAIACCAAPATTTFTNNYAAGVRQQVVHKTAAPLTLADLPEAWKSVPLVHVGPVMGECDPEFVAYFAERAFVGLTPQGWMRHVDASGHVAYKSWPQAEQLLPLASAVVISLEDIQGDWSVVENCARLTKLLVVTQGGEGATLFFKCASHHFPALDVEEISPTGAGDIFAAAFFSVLRQVANPQQAVRLASCLASRSVLRLGLDSVPGPDDLSACAWTHIA